jgi:RimJ/RimL family protein N-acetyltransferase
VTASSTIGEGSATVATLETERLVIRALTPDDAPLILDLLNQPSFLRYIGDRKVRTLEDARRYITTGPVASYARFGFGLCLVTLKRGMEPTGICGLLKRDALPEPDLGFALLPRFWSKGYAFEAASAVLTDARARLALPRVLAITSADNGASIRLLAKLGFRDEVVTRLSEDAPEVRLFAWSSRPAS